MSTEEILNNFAGSAKGAEKAHLNRCVAWMVVAALLLFAGLAAMSSESILAAFLLLSAVLSNQKSNSHHVMAELSNQHQAMAYLIASVAEKRIGTASNAEGKA